MAKIKKLGVIFHAKLQATIMTVAGIIAGFLYSFGGAIYDLYTTGSLNYGSALAFLALIGMPIIFALFGFLNGIFGAFLYNIAASRFGGIELDCIQQ